MSTRCTVTFVDDGGKFSIYQHCDGYPDGEHGVVAAVQGVINSGKAWELPRFEADEFGATYVAVHKTREGHIRLLRSPKDVGDAAYNYTVKQVGQTSKLEVRWGKGAGQFAIVSPEVGRG